MDSEGNKRSFEMMVAFQAEGMCDALRVLVASGLPITESTVVFVKRFEQLAKNHWTGPLFEAWPEMQPNPSAGDLLVRAEILRKSAVAFLTPEQRETFREVNGFDLAMNWKSRGVGEHIAAKPATTDVR